MDGGDDSVTDRGSGVACDRLYRHEEGVSVASVAGAGDPAMRSLERSSVLLPRTSWQSTQSDLARRPGCLPVHETPGARPVLVAEPGRGRGGDLIGTARLSVVRH